MGMPKDKSKDKQAKKDILDAAMESAKAKPPPSKPKASTIVRDSEAPDLPPAANTIFILDLMKQKQERLRRKKKEKEEKKKSGGSYSYNAGGFLGVHKLTQQST